MSVRKRTNYIFRRFLPPGVALRRDFSGDIREKQPEGTKLANDF